MNRFDTFEIGRIDGFPEVGIGIPFDLSGMAYDWKELRSIPNQDLKLDVFCPKFENYRTVRSFRYALTGALSKELGTIHGFQVDRLSSVPAISKNHLSYKHTFGITRNGIITPDADSDFISLIKAKNNSVALTFKTPNHRINQELFETCTKIAGPFALGGWRELSWESYDPESKIYTGKLSGITQEI